MVDLVLIGLGLVVLGWIIQVYESAVNKKKGIDMKFLVVYALGTLVIAMSNYAVNNTYLALNLFAFILALLVVVVIHK